MGAHSLGGAKPDNSGYAGKWTGPQNPGFNELYYLNMVNTTNVWTNVVSPLKFTKSAQVSKRALPSIFQI